MSIFRKICDKVIKCILISSFIVLCICQSFASEVIYDFEGEEYTEYVKDAKILDAELDDDILSGPGYENVMGELGVDDFDITIDYISEHYGDCLNDAESKVIFADSSKLTIGRSNATDDNMSLNGRDRTINAVMRQNEKKVNAASIKSENEETNSKSGMKVTIYVKSSADNPTNPNNGPYKANHVFYTNCSTLNELMNDEGLTSDVGYISTIDGVTADTTLESSYSPDFMHGTWKGTYWCLYVNGKKSEVGADLVEIEDGLRVKWIEEYSEMSW